MLLDLAEAEAGGNRPPSLCRVVTDLSQFEPAGTMREKQLPTALPVKIPRF
jgi:hypothetical protein